MIKVSHQLEEQKVMINSSALCPLPEENRWIMFRFPYLDRLWLGVQMGLLFSFVCYSVLCHDLISMKKYEMAQT